MFPKNRGPKKITFKYRKYYKTKLCFLLLIVQLFQTHCVYLMEKASEFIKSLGIKTILIVNNDGIPIFTYHFSDDSLLKQNILVLSSFFSAFNSFAEALLLSYLSDFGIQDQRLFYKYYSDFFFIIGIDSAKYTDKSFYDMRELVDIILWQISQEFAYMFDDQLKELKSFELNDYISKNMQEELINHMYQGCVDWVDTIKTSSIKDTEIVIPDMNTVQPEDMSKRFGLEAAYVMRGDIIVYQQVYNQAVKLDGDLLSSLFRAIDSFASTQFGFVLREIGLFNQRLFYRQYDKEIYLFLVNDLLYYKYSIADTEDIIYSMIDSIIPRLRANVKDVEKDKVDEDIFKRVLDFEI